jgi:hypothetical protein
VRFDSHRIFLQSWPCDPERAGGYRRQTCLSYGLNEIERKLSPELVLEGEFKCLPLRLLGTLLGLSLKASDLLLQLRDGVFTVLHSQVKAGVGLTESISASLLEPGGDSLLQVEGEFAFLVPKLLLLSKEVRFRGLRGGKLLSESFNAASLLLEVRLLHL